MEFLWAGPAEEEAGGEGGENAGEASGSGPGDPSSGEAAAQGDAQSASKPAERNRRREADWIARRIRGMLDAREKLVVDNRAKKGEKGEGQPVLRAVERGDIALLFRALTNVEYYEEALRRYDIDYYLVGGHAFYAQQEIYDVVNLLRAVACPCDEVALAGTLRSPMFGLLDETLYWLAQHEDGLSGGLWGAGKQRA